MNYPLTNRLRAKIGKVEDNGPLPVDHQFIRCNTLKGRTKMRIHYSLLDQGNSFIN